MTRPIATVTLDLDLVLDILRVLRACELSASLTPPGPVPLAKETTRLREAVELSLVETPPRT